MSIELITILMFGLMLLLIMLGLPIVFVLGGIAAAFALFLWGPASLNLIALKAADLMHHSIMVAVPLFIFMAYMLERAGIAEQLFETMYQWFGPLRGGLAAGSIVACTIIAAMSGISTTGVVLLGIVGLPAMLRRNYNKELAIGSIMAGGALGPLIPPSVGLIVYAMIAGESVGKLFAGGLIPGIVLSILFIAYILLRCYFNESLGPALPPENRGTWAEKFISLKGLIVPILLLVGVLGSIFFGFCTPTEASSVGAFGAIVSAGISRKLSWRNIEIVSFQTLRTTVMVMWVIFAASCFAAIYQGLGASRMIQTLLISWPVNRWVVLIMIQLSWLLLGCFMDGLSIMMLTIPIFLPVVTELGFNSLWFGILYQLNCEFDFLTPPFGINLVVMKGIVPKEITMGTIYRSSFPFLAMQAIGLILVNLFPALAIWLPNLIFGR